MNDTEVELIEEMENDDMDLHYIKSILLNPGHISVEDKKFIMDSMIHADRIFFNGLTTINKSTFIAIVFSRYASDTYIEKYLDEELGYDRNDVINMLSKEDDSSQLFLNRFANVPDIILDNNARVAALSQIKKEFLKKYQESEIDNLMEPFKKMTTEEVVTFYQKNYLK